MFNKHGMTMFIVQSLATVELAAKTYLNTENCIVAKPSKRKQCFCRACASPAPVLAVSLLLCIWGQLLCMFADRVA
jgi:hypothetical protein